MAVSTLFSTDASAITVDGNLNDWGVTPGAYGNPAQWAPNPANPFIYYIQEDQTGNSSAFLNPGWGGQEFDVEAIYFTRDASSAYFAVVSGFPLTGRPGYTAGDFAIDFGSNGTWDAGVETTGTNQGKYYKNATFSDPYFLVSTPFNLTGGTLVGNTQFAYNATSYIANGHYVFEIGIPLSYFGSFWANDLQGQDNPDFTLHWTMSCGNDALDLKVAGHHSPEPATAALLGVGLAGLAAWKRKKQSLA